MNSRSNIDVQKQQVKQESGFTLIEAICAIAILTIGLISTVAAITASLKYQKISRNITEAKTMLLAQIEEIHSLRDSRRLRFKQITNSPAPVISSGVAFTGFPTTFQNVYDQPGDDGVYGTADDIAGGGTARPGFRRRVDIRDAPGDSNLKIITVTVQYPGPEGQVYSLDIVSFLNNDFKQQ